MGVPCSCSSDRTQVCCPIERVKKTHQHQVVGDAWHNDRPRSKKVRRVAQLVLHDDAVGRTAERERRRQRERPQRDWRLHVGAGNRHDLRRGGEPTMVPVNGQEARAVSTCDAVTASNGQQIATHLADDSHRTCDAQFEVK